VNRRIYLIRVLILGNKLIKFKLRNNLIKSDISKMS
jgi:hypothetical protein